MSKERALLKEFIDFVDSYEFYPTERNIIWEIVSRTQELLAQPEQEQEPLSEDAVDKWLGNAIDKCLANAIKDGWYPVNEDSYRQGFWDAVKFLGDGE